eukprot:PhM_4_TR3093/c4_g2_i4/m.104505
MLFELLEMVGGIATDPFPPFDVEVTLRGNWGRRARAKSQSLVGIETSLHHVLDDVAVYSDVISTIPPFLGHVPWSDSTLRTTTSGGMCADLAVRAAMDEHSALRAEANLGCVHSSDWAWRTGPEAGRLVAFEAWPSQWNSGEPINTDYKAIQYGSSVFHAGLPTAAGTHYYCEFDVRVPRRLPLHGAHDGVHAHGQRDIRVPRRVPRGAQMFGATTTRSLMSVVHGRHRCIDLSRSLA